MVAANGPAVLGKLAMVLLVAYVGYIVHAALVYSTTVATLGKVSPLQFFKGMLPAIMMAFSSASSVGTLPFTMECSEKLGAKREISSFVLPLGATINMDGTAIYQGVCAVFIAACYGIHLDLGNMITIVFTATLASIGTAGVPGAGMVMPSSSPVWRRRRLPERQRKRITDTRHFNAAAPEIGAAAFSMLSSFPWYTPMPK